MMCLQLLEPTGPSKSGNCYLQKLTELFVLICLIYRVLLDDVDVKGEIGGKAYTTYGISTNGAVAVVRPDGYTGMIAPLGETGAKEILDYFSGFMKI